MRLSALTALTLFASTAAAQPPQDMLAERVAALEGRHAALEQRLDGLERLVQRGPAASAPSAPQAGYPQAQQRYTVDAGGIYWPAGTMPAAGYGVPQAYYGGGFGDAGGGCSGGNCGGGSAMGGYRIMPFGGAFRRR